MKKKKKFVVCESDRFRFTDKVMAAILLPSMACNVFRDTRLEACASVCFLSIMLEMSVAIEFVFDEINFVGKNIKGAHDHDTSLFLLGYESKVKFHSFYWNTCSREPWWSRSRPGTSPRPAAPANDAEGVGSLACLGRRPAGPAHAFSSHNDYLQSPPSGWVGLSRVFFMFKVQKPCQTYY